MQEAVVPAGGLPWSVAIPAFAAMAAAVVALWRSRGSAGKAYGKLLTKKDAALEACERRCDDVQRELKDLYRESIDILARARAVRSRDPLYPPRAPAATLEGMKKEFRNLSQVISPEDLRRARDDMDRTA